MSFVELILVTPHETGLLLVEINIAPWLHCHMANMVFTKLLIALVHNSTATQYAARLLLVIRRGHLLSSTTALPN